MHRETNRTSIVCTTKQNQQQMNERTSRKPTHKTNRTNRRNPQPPPPTIPAVLVCSLPPPPRHLTPPPHPSYQHPLGCCHCRWCRCHTTASVVMVSFFSSLPSPAAVIGGGLGSSSILSFKMGPSKLIGFVVTVSPSSNTALLWMMIVARREQ